MQGQIVKIVSDLHYVSFDGELYPCKCRGIFRKEHITPLVGDYVLFSIEKKLIEKILPRKNEFNRPKVSNIDQAFIITSLVRPDFSLNLLDKLLVTMELHNVEAIICITKEDLVSKEELDKYYEVLDYYKNIGYKVVSNNDIDKISNIINGEKVGTLFISYKAMHSKEHWMVYNAYAKGSVIVDDGAKKALLERKEKEKIKEEEEKFEKEELEYKKQKQKKIFKLGTIVVTSIITVIIIILIIANSISNKNYISNYCENTSGKKYNSVKKLNKKYSCGSLALYLKDNNLTEKDYLELIQTGNEQLYKDFYKIEQSELIEKILTKYGIPYLFKTDKRTVFEYNKKGTTSDEDNTFTQFAYVCSQLGTNIETSSTPEFKPRIERLFESFQLRLIPELRLANITTIAKAIAILIYKIFLLSIISFFIIG